MELEIDKKYRCRSQPAIKYVEITGVSLHHITLYEGKAVHFKDQEDLQIEFFPDGTCPDDWTGETDLVSEYSEFTGTPITECVHEYVNVGFTSITMACKHCGTAYVEEEREFVLKGGVYRFRDAPDVKQIEMGNILPSPPTELIHVIILVVYTSGAVSSYIWEGYPNGRICRNKKDPYDIVELQ